jgi:nucleoside diphosphate kinase
MNFGNIMKFFIQNGLNMMGLFMINRSKRISSYNMEHKDTTIFVSIYARPLRQASHSTDVGTSKTVKEMFMRIYDKGRINTIYSD